MDEHAANIALWISTGKHGFTEEKNAGVVPTDFARQLERELEEANRKLDTVKRAVDIAEQLVDAQTDKQCELSTSMNEAIAFITLEQTEKERDAALARVRVLEEALKPFAQPDLSRITSSNVQGGDSPVFGKDSALLIIKHFVAAQSALSPQEG